MSGEQTDDLNLSGVWQGLFSYPDGRNRDPVSFVATLAELDGWIDGTTEEPGATAETSGLALRATIQGRRTGRTLTFLKLYDGRPRGYDTVTYQGAINDDASEIEGRWSIPGNWSGSFLMIRSSRPEVALEREAAEEA